jgi:hypothetical protein
MGRDGAAGGTTYVTLLITHRTKGTSSLTGSCSLSGTPTTQFGNFVGSGGPAVFRAVGPAATKQTIAGRGATIVVKPGAVASVTVGIATAGNYPSSKCGEANATRVRLVFQKRNHAVLHAEYRRRLHETREHVHNRRRARNALPVRGLRKAQRKITQYAPRRRQS